MPTARLRIVSDLHVGEPHSRVPSVDRLAPLWEGAQHVVLNGDTLDTRFVDLDPAARRHRADFEALAAAHAGRLTVLTGNHDPDLSPHHHLDLDDGRIFVTHGDAVFAEMAPWGWEAAHFRSEQERRLAAVPEDERAALETRLRVCKEAVWAIRHLSPHRPGRSGHRWKRRILAILTLARAHRVWQCWREMPAAAARFAQTYRPAAGIVIVGHVHRAGLWMRAGRVVINTGAATLATGALAVDLVGRQLFVRHLHFRRHGVAIGAVHRTLSLDAAPGTATLPQSSP